MPCDVCGDEVGLINHCNYCGGAFCSAHTLPEKHRCPALSQSNTHGPDFRDVNAEIGATESDIGDSSSNKSANNKQEPTGAEAVSDPSPDVNPDGTIAESANGYSKSSSRVSKFEIDTDQILKSLRGAFASRNYTGTCPHCRRKVRRFSSGRVAHCDNCGWQPGLPYLRYLTHYPAWFAYTKAVVKLTIVLAVSITLISAIIGTGVPAIDQPVNNVVNPVAGMVNSTFNNSDSSVDSNDDDGVIDIGGPAVNESKLEQKIHDRVNAVRENRGLSNLARNEALNDLAQSHSDHMAENGYFDHTQPNGVTMEQRYDSAGLQCSGGENIFRTRWEGYSRTESELANAVVEGWLKSPGHRENLLREGWAQEGMGVSVVENPDEGGTEIYVTQNFC